MDTMGIIYSSLGQLPEPETGDCFWCGMRPGIYEKNKIIGDNFTNLDRARGASNKICKTCATCLKEPNLRRMSWLAQLDQPIKYFKREEIGNFIFAPKQTPFVFYVTTSFKKLGQAKAPVNSDENNFVILFEEELATINFGLLDTWNIINIMYSIPKEEEGKKQPKTFFTKEEIRTGVYQPNRIREFGFEKWYELEKQLKLLRNTASLNLMVYCANATMKGISKHDKSS